MINVRWYKTATDRKQNKVFAEFFTEIEPVKVDPVNAELTGKELVEAQNRYADAVEQARLNAEFMALNQVRDKIGYEGVLVAYEVKEDQ